MSQCCKISNPSSDESILLDQQQKLLDIVGDKLVHPPADHVCSMSICVTMDTLEQSLKNLPESFCFKVTVPHTASGPRILTDKQVTELRLRNLLSDHSVAKAFHDKLVTPDTCVMVVDTEQPQLPLAIFVKASLELIATTKLLVIAVGKGHVKDSWKKSLTDSGIQYTMLEHLPADEVLSFLSECKHHILTGCTVGLNGALISGSNSVVRPKPWSPGNDLKFKSEWKTVGCGWTHTKYYDQSYYINLDRRTDRLQHMQLQLQRFGMASARIPAVDGKQVSWKPEYGVLSNYWNTGAFAYCLSYRVAIIDAMRNGYDKVLIMDDDCVLQDNLWEVLDKAWNDLPEEWHMLYLGANHGHPQPVSVPTEQDRVGDYLYKLKGSMGSHAIILNKCCFQTILNFVAAPYAPLDMFFSMYQKFFPCYVTYPGLASQLAGVSDIINKEVNYTKDWGVNYINHIPGRT